MKIEKFTKFVKENPITSHDVGADEVFVLLENVRSKS